MAIVAVGIGSNVGDRFGHIGSAVAGLIRISRLVAVSPVYESAPVGGPPQGRYLNAVALIETKLSPRALLTALLDIERTLGRKRRVRWGPRTIDLDILLYDDLVVQEDDLAIPHPALSMRRFVIQPLLDVWPAAVLPDGRAVVDLRQGVADQELASTTGPFDVATGYWRSLDHPAGGGFHGVVRHPQ